jgi:thiol-disulfide isomerase/thioredoxin
MENILYYFKTAFIAEHIKKKGTGIYMLSLIIGSLSPIILFISRLNGGTRQVPRTAHNLYSNFIENALELFAYYMLPFLIILVASRITQLDHKNKGWSLMETLPVEKYANYFSKFSILIIANTIAVTAFVLLSIFFVFFLSMIDNTSSVGVLELPIEFLVNLTIRLVVSTFFLSGLQFILSVVISNFLWPIFIGIIGFSLNTFFNESGIFFSWYPYSPISIIFKYPKGSDLGNVLTYIDYMSCIGAIFFLYIGFHWFKNKNLKSVFFGNKKQIAQTYFFLIPMILLFVYMQQPKQFEVHNRTVLQGTIDSETSFNIFTIVESFTNKTIAKIPITDNEFNHVFNESISLSSYNIFLDNAHRSKLIFGAKDSVFIDFKIAKNFTKLNITGTRLAENTIRIRNERSIVPYFLENESTLVNSTKLFSVMREEWNDRVEAVKKFKTVDNYKFRDDFEKRNEILLLAEYHYFLKEYKKKVALLYPTKKIEIPTDLKLFENPIPFDETLLNNNSYLGSIVDQLIENDNEVTDKDTKVLKAISALKPSKFKDMLLFWQLNKSIQEVSENEEIDVLVKTYLQEIEDVSFKNRILKSSNIKRSLEIGSSAPFFNAETVDGNMVAIDDLKGKYTVIDVWATWCAPCRKDAPYFEKFALKYTSDTVQFVSLSVDDEKALSTWEIHVKEKAKSILHVRSVNQKKFMETYNIKTIPRYMVLDPNGKIVNLELSRPSKSTFEKMLKESIGLLKD